MANHNETGAEWRYKLRSRSLLYALVTLVPVIVRVVLLDDEAFAGILTELSIYVAAVLAATGASKGIETFGQRKRSRRQPGRTESKPEPVNEFLPDL